MKRSKLYSYILSGRGLFVNVSLGFLVVAGYLLSEMVAHPDGI